MKKVLCIIIALTMLSLCACGNSETNKPNNTTNPTDAISEQPTSNNDDSSTKNIELQTTYKVPLKDIVVDMPNYQQIECGYTKLFTVGREYNIAVTSCKNVNVTELKEAHNSAFAKYQNNYQNYAKINELIISNDSTSTVNGVEVYRFEGELACSDDTGEYKIYTVGYSFIMDGIPCSIEGTVLNKSQPQEMITEIKDTVDAIIKTLRSTK